MCRPMGRRLRRDPGHGIIFFVRVDSGSNPLYKTVCICQNRSILSACKTSITGIQILQDIPYNPDADNSNCNPEPPGLPCRETICKIIGEQVSIVLLHHSLQPGTGHMAISFSKKIFPERFPRTFRYGRTCPDGRKRKATVTAVRGPHRSVLSCRHGDNHIS